MHAERERERDRETDRETERETETETETDRQRQRDRESAFRKTTGHLSKQKRNSLIRNNQKHTKAGRIMAQIFE